jgi:hypothetical protein
MAGASHETRPMTILSASKDPFKLHLAEKQHDI